MLVADLRLLGWLALRYSVTTVTGVGLFITRASAYVTPVVRKCRRSISDRAQMMEAHALLRQNARTKRTADALA